MLRHLPAGSVAAALAAAGGTPPPLLPPRLLSCDFDEEWASYGATLDALWLASAAATLPGPAGLPKLCAEDDRALFNWSDRLAGLSWPEEDPVDTLRDLMYACDPDASRELGAERCNIEMEIAPCIYGVVSASTCQAVMYLSNLDSMTECCTATAVGAAKGLHWLLRSGDKMLEFIDSSTWPVSLRDIVAIVVAYEPVLSSTVPLQSAAALLAAHVQGGVPRPWDPGGDLWLGAEEAANRSLAMVAGWSWPPGAAVGLHRPGAHVHGGPGTRPLLIRIYAFGTHCSVMAEPISAVALLFPSELDLRVTWRGTKEYCGYHSGNWPVVTHDANSYVREVYDAFHHKEENNLWHRSHRDSLRTPWEFEEAFGQALAREGAAFAGADVALCSEPAIACLPLHRAGKPVIGYFGVHVAFMLKDPEDQLKLYHGFRDVLAQDQQSTLATVAPYISMQILYHVPVEVPAVRPVSLYTLPAVYTGAAGVQVLLNKRPIAFWDLGVLLDTFAKRNDKIIEFIDASELFDLGRHSFMDWAAFRAAVYFPYDWLQTMAFYDWINMGLPTFVPDTPMYTLSRGTNAFDEWWAPAWHVPTSVYPHHYGNWDDHVGRVYWWLLTDFRALPGVGTFSSVPELFVDLASPDRLVRMSGTLRQAQLERVMISGSFWRSALLRALVDPARV